MVLARALLVLIVLLVAAPAAQAADVDFAPVAVGTTPDTRQVEFVNNGDDEIGLGSTSIIGNDAAAFQVMSDGCLNATLSLDESCVVSVRFDPLRTGLSEATLQTSVVGSAELLSATLAGEGGESLRLSPGSLNFGTLPRTSTAPRTLDVVVENVSGQPMTVPYGTFTQRLPFGVSGSTCTGQTLAPGAGCRLTVRIFARTAGTYTDTLRLMRGARVLASAPVTATIAGLPTPAPPTPRTPDVTSTLNARLQAAFGAWRRLGAAGLRRGGFVIGGLTTPVYGDAYLVVRSRKRIVAKGAKVLVAGKPARLRVGATRFGRKLLAQQKARRLDVALRFVAASDQRVSRVATTVRVPAK